MKKAMYLVLAICMVVGTLACFPHKAFAADGTIDIGIVLPTREETRWLMDEVDFKKIIDEQGYKAEILFSQKSSATERTNVETFISRGAKAIILCPFDGAAAAAAAQEAAKEGIKVIAYDRLITDTDAVDYYITFDNGATGTTKGQYLIDMAGDTKGNNLYMYSGALTDFNSYIYFEGAWKALQPKIADGTFIVRNCEKAVEYSDKPVLTREEQFAILSTIDTEWDMQVSKTLAEAHLAAADASAKGTVFVLSPADDDCARALSDVFLADAEVTKWYITGADGVEGSVQYIIDGKQSMTVYLDTSMLVEAAMDTAVKLVAGEEPEFSTTFNNNVIDVPTVSRSAVLITRDNIVEKFFESGIYDGSQFENWQ